MFLLGGTTTIVDILEPRMKTETPQQWTTEAVLALARAYQPASVLAAAAELEVFGPLAEGPLTAAALAQTLRCDVGSLTTLLDALAALRFIKKHKGEYRLASGLESVLTAGGDRSVLGMVQHQANCLRRWAQLARVVRTGRRPADPTPSVRGASGDLQAFIEAMANISAPAADDVIRAVRPLQFQHLLDVGGASGTWTLAFLRACPKAVATLFDLPEVIPLARSRLTRAGVNQRVRLVPGDYLADSLPQGADLVWASAIVHQNSREENRRLFAQSYRALQPGGRIAIRDVLMDSTRTRPVAGALFAVNMLVGTKGGGTFTFKELREDLESGGFTNTTLARRDVGMNSVILATKPAARPAAVRTSGRTVNACAVSSSSAQTPQLP